MCAGSMGPAFDPSGRGRQWLRFFFIGHGKSVARNQGVKSNSSHCYHQ
jgi:hypothetical protein